MKRAAGRSPRRSLCRAKVRVSVSRQPLTRPSPTLPPSRAADTAQQADYHFSPAHRNHTLDASTDSACATWQASAGCDPDGPPETQNDKPCGDVVVSEWEGACVCARGRREKFGCGHQPFTCRRVCEVVFPAVVAESAQSFASNQLARYLVQVRDPVTSLCESARTGAGERQTRPLTHSLTHARTHLPTHSLPHSLTPSLSLSLPSAHYDT
jgi:hypothetical protein